MADREDWYLSAKARRASADNKPLYYARINVGAAGLEPATSWSQTMRASQLRHAPLTKNNEQKVMGNEK